MLALPRGKKLAFLASLLPHRPMLGAVTSSVRPAFKQRACNVRAVSERRAPAAIGAMSALPRGQKLSLMASFIPHRPMPGAVTSSVQTAFERRACSVRTASERRVPAAIRTLSALPRGQKLALLACFLSHRPMPGTVGSGVQIAFEQRSNDRCPLLYGRCQLFQGAKNWPYWLVFSRTGQCQALS